MAEALYYRVHEARVAYVVQAAKSFFPTTVAPRKRIAGVVIRSIIAGFLY